MPFKMRQLNHSVQEPRSEGWWRHSPHLVAACAAAVLATSAPAGDALADLAPSEPSSSQLLLDEPDQYTQTVQRRHNRSKGIVSDPGSNEDMLSSHSEEMFTHDAWVGMRRSVPRPHFSDLCVREYLCSLWSSTQSNHILWLPRLPLGSDSALTGCTLPPKRCRGSAGSWTTATMWTR